MHRDIAIKHMLVKNENATQTVDGFQRTLQTCGMERLAKLRKAAGLTQVQLAELADTEQAHISKLETGNVGASVEMLEKLAAALNISVAQFFDPPPQYQRAIDAIDALPPEHRESAIRSLEAVSEALRDVSREK